MDDKFLKKLIETFKAEAEEHYNNLVNGLFAIEKLTPGENYNASIETLHRDAHSLKGAARAVGYSDIEDVCKSLESLFASIKKGSLAIDKAVIDIAFTGVDIVKELIYLNPEEITDETRVNSESFSIKVLELLNKDCDALLKPYENEPVVTEFPHLTNTGDPPPVYDDSMTVNNDYALNTYEPASGKETKKVDLQDNLRIASGKIDNVYLQAEELVYSKLAIEQLTKELNELSLYLDKVKFDNSKSVNSLQRNKFSRYNASLFDQSFEKFNEIVNSIDTQIKKFVKTSKINQRKTGLAVNELLESLKDILMLDFSHLLHLFPKLVRDLSSELNKDVNFTMAGTDIQIDRRILDVIKEPLIHIVRNAIDHGLERPEERIAAGKPPKGNLSIIIKPIGTGKIEIEISDDGCGIDTDKLKQSALNKGIITLEKSISLSSDEAVQLIFVSGISTKKMISDISGYGLGMAIVKEKVEKLQGTITIKSDPLQGTKINITLPNTLTMMRGLVVQCVDSLFAIPSNYISQVIRINKNDIKRVENRNTIMINGIPITVLDLCKILGFKKYIGFENISLIKIVVVSIYNKLIAFSVNDILEDIELLIKPLNKQLSKVKNISGATLLGNGRLVPVLNIPELINNTGKNFEAGRSPYLGKDSAVKNILVVDDSITSRMLLQDILETAGYNVKTSSDGMNAIKTIKENNFDLIVSDIDMPLMNGFQLTKLIKTTKYLKDIPVILVTALSKDEDRIKGMEAGANAYIVKSDFTQSNLLEVISRYLQ
jgi:two-component system chemotaxis sensor kinase CheA